MIFFLPANLVGPWSVTDVQEMGYATNAGKEGRAKERIKNEKKVSVSVYLWGYGVDYSYHPGRNPLGRKPEMGQVA